MLVIYYFLKQSKTWDMYTHKFVPATRIFFACIVIFFLLGFNICTYAQEKINCNEITGEMGFTIRSVVIKGRWVPEDLQKKVEETVGVGKLYEPQKINPAMEFVRTELISGEERFTLQLVGAT